ncbi:MAG: four helix bundle protein [Chloroflexaceae bacterium]|nr:four helix bundle protein [Chloroflexaceae bacterium]
MKQQDWEQTVSSAITTDTLWRMRAYRLALFIADQSWDDCTLLFRDRRTMSLADQLYAAVGSVSANIAEGYSRGTGKDRARFYEYALGSARESRDWYYKARRVIGEDRSSEQIEALTEVIRLLLVMVADQRKNYVREEVASYDVSM